VRHIYLTAVLIFGWNNFSSCGWYLEHDSEVATHVCVRQFDFKIRFHFVELKYSDFLAASNRLYSVDSNWK
jgi:hypothetical protein